MEVNKNKVLSLLGLCRKSGNLTLGFDACIESVRLKKTQLILMTMDLSDNTKQKFCGYVDADLIYNTDLSMDDIHKTLGRSSGLISINEMGFAKKFKQLLSI